MRCFFFLITLGDCKNLWIISRLVFYVLKFSKLNIWLRCLLQDLTSKPKYLVTFTVGYDQKKNIDAAVKKVSVCTHAACLIKPLEVLELFFHIFICCVLVKMDYDSNVRSKKPVLFSFQSQLLNFPIQCMCINFHVEAFFAAHTFWYLFTWQYPNKIYSFQSILLNIWIIVSLSVVTNTFIISHVT